MDPGLYRAATTEDLDYFAKAVAGEAGRMLIEQVTPRGNSVLHIAASFGYVKIVNFILPTYPHLVELKNYKGDLPLHVASSAGHLDVVKFLVSFAQNSACRKGPNLLWENNEQGNTPLHMALENIRSDISLFLFQADPKVSYRLNREGKSPFYMATKYGDLKIVGPMATKITSRLDSYNQCKEVEQEAGFAERNGLKPEEPEVSRHHYPKAASFCMLRFWCVSCSKQSPVARHIDFDNEFNLHCHSLSCLFPAELTVAV